MSDDRAELLAAIKAKAVVRGDFVLSSGQRADFYVDLRRVLLDGRLAPLAGRVMLDLTADLAYDAVGGLTMGADPVAFCTAGVLAARGRLIKAFSVRKEVKDHGGGGRIAGALEPGDRVVVTEDAVTRGTSPLEAVAVVREHGAVPILVLAVVDRGGTCGRMCAELGLPFLALLGAPDLGFDYGS